MLASLQRAMSTPVKESPRDKEKKRKRGIRVEQSQDEAGGGDTRTVETKRIRTVELSSAKEASSSKQSLFYAEEEEVDRRDVKSDVEQFKTVCDELRKTFREIKALKDTKEKDDNSTIEKKRVEATLQFVILKKLNRLAHIRCKKVRDATNEAKQRIDTYHLQLQNLLYEVMHLEKEITKCLEFKSKDEEIELVPLEQFYKDAPDEISKPDATKQDLHQQTLARLDWELEQRKQLATELKEAQSSRSTIEDEIKTKQEYLETLQPKLNAILQSTKPVQEYLHMPFDDIRDQHITACHLPHPLYVLYMQSNAYRQACDKFVSVTLTGDLDTAKSLDMSLPLDEDESDSDQEEQDQDKKSSKRRRKTVDVKLQKKERILKKHPLTVLIQVKCKDGSYLQLTFYYLMYLHIVTVRIEVHTSTNVPAVCVSGGDLLSPDTILNALYAEDYGESTPNQANVYELNKYGLKDFTHYIPQLGRPYLWAQWLAGLWFLNGEAPSKPETAVSVSNMQETMRRLRQRLKARLSLLHQLNSLERNSIPVSSEYLPLFPVKLQSALTKFQRSTHEDFVAVPHTKFAVDEGLAEETDLYFTAVMERLSAKLTALIVVSPDYPSTPPLFAVCINWQSQRTALNDSHIRDMEEEVNVHWEELVNQKSHDQLLTNQLQRLLMCFDVYLETEAQNSVKEGPMEISKEKVTTRSNRGPSRTKPYKYCPDVGIFTQRCS